MEMKIKAMLISSGLFGMNVSEFFFVHLLQLQKMVNGL